MANFPLTIAGARISPLLIPESGFGDATIRYLVYYTDINVASATGASDTITLTLGTTPQNWAVTGARAYVQTAFAGTTAFTMVVGTTTNTNAFLASTSVLTAGLIQPSTGLNTTASIANSTATSSLSMVAVFTNATGGSPSALSAGVLQIVLSILNLDGMY